MSTTRTEETAAIKVEIRITRPRSRRSKQTSRPGLFVTPPAAVAEAFESFHGPLRFTRTNQPLPELDQPRKL